MKTGGIAALAIAIAAALMAALLSIRGWRIASPRISNLPGAANRSLSARECDELCRDAFLPLQGVSPRMTNEALYALLIRTYGQFSAKELFDAYRDGRMIVTQNRLFFPTAQLCRQQNLSGDCAKLCAELMRTR